MLLRVTTHSKQLLLRVTDDPLYRATAIDLPPGTYIFEVISNPVSSDGADWIALDQAHLAKLQLGPDAIVGMAYEDLARCNRLARSLSFYDPSMVIDFEDITPVMLHEEPVETSVQPQDEKLPCAVTPRQIIRYPNFVRYDPPRGSNVSVLTIYDRRRRLHPAARRAC